MSLPVSVLLEQLADFAPTLQNMDPELQLVTVRDFPGWDMPLRDDILYLTPEASRLPASEDSAALSAKPLCFAIPADLAGDLPLNRADCRLLLLPDSTSYPEVCVRLRGLFAQHDAWEQMLGGALKRDASLQSILDVCGIDPSLTVLVWDPALRLRALWPSVSPSPVGRFEVTDFLRGACQRVCLEHALCGKTPHAVDASRPDAAETALLAPVFLEGEPFLFSALLSQSGKLPKLDRFRFLRLMQGLDALACDGWRLSQAPASFSPSESSPVLPESAAACLRPVRDGETAYFRLFLISFEDYVPLRARMLLESLRRFLPTEPVIMLDEQLCILRAGGVGLNAELENRFNNLLVSQNAYCGISKRLYSPRECRTAFEQARIALHMGLADLRPPKNGMRCFQYGDYAEMHSLAMYARKMGDLLSLLPTRLVGFYRDSQRDDSGLRLLHIYLDSGMSPSATAKALNIHRNTVVYRLNRMKEDYGIDLSNADCLHDVTRMLTIARYYRHYGSGDPLKYE